MRKRLVGLALVFAIVGIAACGGTDSNGQSGSGDDGAAAGDDGATGMDGTAGGGDGAGGDGTATGDGTFGDDASNDATTTDGTLVDGGGGSDGTFGDGTAGDGGINDGSAGEASNGGDGGAGDGGTTTDSAGGEAGAGDAGARDGSVDGNAGDGAVDGGGCNSCGVGQYCVNNACVCPPYQTFCSGRCIPTNGDPNNCGGCGVQCTGQQVCSGGACTSGCLPGLVACGNRCFDTQTDNGHCGSCNGVCGGGTGCVAGQCVPTPSLDAGTVNCVNGGPPIDGGTGAGCLGQTAQVTFRWALCSCTDIDISAPLLTDAYDSTQGPYRPGGLGGGVGVDRDALNWSSSVDIGGDFWCSGTSTMRPSGPGSIVREELHLEGSIAAASPFTVARNAYVVGSVSGVTIQGTLTHPSSVPAPCDCSQSQIIPVAAIVAAHRAPNNDNPTIGLDPNIAANGPGTLRIDLPCGNFYLSRINTSRPLVIYAHGRTALYIDGDVTSSSPLWFALDPTAELDVFIAGTIVTSQVLTVGSPAYPALMRVYVGSTARLALSSQSRIGGNLYAANSQLVDWSGGNDVYGAVFAGDFKESHDTAIHYDRAVLNAGVACNAPPPGADAGADSGSTSCVSCRDCGNQSCNGGTCGPCTTNKDCCAPLQCNTMTGVCELVR